MNFTDSRIGIIGYGKVGSTLAIGWITKGIEVWATDRDINKLKLKIENQNIHICQSSQELLKACPIVFLCLREDDLTAQIKIIKENNPTDLLLVHTAGGLSREIFPNDKFSCSTAIFHPYRSFTNISTEPGMLKNSFIGIVADPAIYPILAYLAEQLSAYPVKLEESKLPLYHASATLLAGGTIALIDNAVKFLEKSGFPKPQINKMVITFVRQILDNVEKQGTDKALSGPWKRGAVEVIQKHIDVITEQFPDSIDLYLALAGQVIDTENLSIGDIFDNQ